MQRIMLKSKIHRATLTGLELHYEGSLSMDPLLMEKADIRPGEQIHVLNLSNAERFVTYAITGKRGSGEMMLNGPAARLGVVGDRIIVITYCHVDEREADAHKPVVVHVDEHNRARD